MRFAVFGRVAMLSVAPAVIACSSPEHESSAFNSPASRSSDGNQHATLEDLQRLGLACSPEVLRRFHGRVASEALGVEMMEVTDTNRVRWVRPGAAFTAENLAGRLTVYLDEGARVTQTICG